MSGHINLIPFFSHGCIIFYGNGCTSLVIQEEIVNITAAFVLEQIAAKRSQAGAWSRHRKKSGTTCLGHLSKAPLPGA